MLPKLSLRPLMLTGSPCQGHAGWLDTKATRVEAPVELNAFDVCAVRGVELIVADSANYEWCQAAHGDADGGRVAVRRAVVGLKRERVGADVACIGRVGQVGGRA